MLFSSRSSYQRNLLRFGRPYVFVLFLMLLSGWMPQINPFAAKMLWAQAGTLLPITHISSISTGLGHTCAVTTSGTVKCWGYNGSGQLGDDTRTTRDHAVTVIGLSGVTAVAAGSDHTCALRGNGTVACWGSNSQGQLGDGTTSDSKTPVDVNGLTGVVELSAGTNYVCALVSYGGTVKCWGHNNYGQLGNGSTTNSSSPVAVSGISDVYDIAAGYDHTCAKFFNLTTSKDEVKCWGDNAYGQLGDGSTTNSNTPVAVSNLSDVDSITIGEVQSCAILKNGTIKCWGGNSSGTLGDGSTIDSATPVSVNGITSATQIDAGNTHTCARLADSTIKCWGQNNSGKLGNGNQTSSSTPVNVSSLSGAASVGTGYAYSCAVTQAGGVKCWGRNFISELGDGTSNDSLTPVDVVTQADPTPSVSIATSTLQATNNSFIVPVNFAGNGANIASVGFAIDYDQSCLTYGTVSGFPAGFVNSINHDLSKSAGELGIAIWDQTDPIGSFSDGVLVNISFTVKQSCLPNNGSLQPSIVFASTPAPSFGNSNGDSVSGVTNNGTLTILFNQAPTDVTLTPASLAENSAVNTTVGNLAAVDPDAGDSHTFALVSGTGSTDNATFEIVGNALKSKQSFDFETKASYAIRVRTTDAGGLFVEKALTVNVVDVNEAPTLVQSTGTSIAENAAVNTSIGTLSSVDPDASNTHAYTVEGADAASFNINGNTLRNNAVFNYETKASYNITIRSTDQGGLSVATPFVITIQNVNDAPVAVNDSFTPAAFGANAFALLDVLGNDTDEDVNSTRTIQSVATPSQGTVSIQGNQLRYTSTTTYNGPVTLSYVVLDNNGLTSTGTVSLVAIANNERGDCNADGVVNAADWTRMVLELFDQDDGVPWYEIYQNSVVGSPRGCDANANAASNLNGTSSAIVTIADVSCAVLVYFGDTSCTQPALRSASQPLSAQLTIGKPPLEAARDKPDALTVPIRLTTNHRSISAAAFTLRIDPKRATFDATDADGDAIPDALHLNLPTGVYAWVQAEEDAIQIAILNLTLPMQGLADGDIATISLMTRTDMSLEPSNNPIIWLENASLGDMDGQSVDLLLDETNATSTRTLYLPMIRH